ncbi:MAG: hypothetical protein QXF15_01550 [Candidatus Aenigmatarchaeota archaeon]|nr:hypothetical protein [Candidatus Aenigmarchaeota archaeon]
MKGQWDLSELLINIVTLGYTILAILAILFNLINLNLIFDVNQLNREAQDIGYMFISSKCAAYEENNIIYQGILNKTKLDNLNLENCFITDKSKITEIQIDDYKYSIPQSKYCSGDKIGKYILPVLILDDGNINQKEITVKVCDLK